MIFYRIYQIVVMAPILLVATILTALITVVGSALGFGRVMGYYPEVLWSKLFCWLAFVKVTVTGRENIDKHTSYVFVANHQSAYDIFTVYGYLRHNFRWMMKESLRKIPFVGYACQCSHQIFVDKSTPAALKRTMERAEEQLRGGMSLVVFPEGARTLDGRMHRFRKGAFLLATEFNLPVVPLTIDGAYKVLPRTGTLPRPGHIRLTIHKPITPPEGGYNLAEVMEQAAATVESSLKPQERRATR